jgi:phage shock protein C
MSERKRLYRSRDDRMIAGVMGGIADYLDIDPSIARIIFVLTIILTGVLPGVLLYLLAAIIVPLDKRPRRDPDDY